MMPPAGDGTPVTSSKMVSKDQDVNTRKVFVGGLNMNTDSESLRNFFSQYGAIEDAHVMDTWDQRAMQRRSRCFGFVVFSAPEAVDTVIAQAKFFIDEKEVEVKRVDDKKGSPEGRAEVDARKVFVGGLKDEMDEEQLRGFFLTIDAELVDAKVMRDPVTKVSRGFGWVTFSDKNFVDIAVKNGQNNQINGHWIDVKPAAREKGKGKGKGKGGKGKGLGKWGQGDAYGGFGGGSSGYDSGFGQQQQYGGGFAQPQYGGSQFGYGKGGMQDPYAFAQQGMGQQFAAYGQDPSAQYAAAYAQQQQQYGARAGPY